MKHLPIPLLTTLLVVCRGNIWDNVFSHLYNEPPSIALPPSFVVQLYDSETNAPFGNVTVSSDLNKIRIVIDSNNDLYGVAMTYTFDFTKGAVYLQIEDECYVQDNRDLSRITVTFLLKSYDLFTYFETKSGYYYYVISDPRGSNFHENMGEFVTYKNVEKLPTYVRLKFAKKEMKLLEIKYKLQLQNPIPHEASGVLKPNVVTDYNVTDEDFKIINKEKCISDIPDIPYIPDIPDIDIDDDN